jgi:hypothetical protein
MHEMLLGQGPLADKVHCAYVVHSELADAGQSHVTWAHGELLDRVVSPVSRRELHLGGLCLFGPAPAAVVPEVSDQELADYILGDLRDFWYPHTDQPDLWLQDIWVDLGLLTLARARVTMQDGRLITKREALEVLSGLGAPADVLRDIYQRRYETGPQISQQWRARRGFLARTYVRAGIEQVLALPRALQLCRRRARGGHGRGAHRLLDALPEDRLTDAIDMLRQWASPEPGDVPRRRFRTTAIFDGGQHRHPGPPPFRVVRPVHAAAFTLLP